MKPSTLELNICRDAFESLPKNKARFSFERRSDVEGPEQPYQDSSCELAWDLWMAAWAAGRAAPFLMESATTAPWSEQRSPDSKGRILSFFLEGMRELGLGDGSRGWIEQEENGQIVRDPFSLEGEVYMGFLTIKDVLDKYKALLEQAPVAWYDRGAGAFYLSEESVPITSRTPGRVHPLIYNSTDAPLRHKD